MTSVSVVNHDLPTDPDELMGRRRVQRTAAVAAAKAKVLKATAHLAAAKEALAQATAARKELG